MTHEKKPVLDVTAGGRMMWFDKENPLAVFTDIRNETHTLPNGQFLEINPDIEADFTNLPFENESFRLVVFDPPHSKWLGKNSIMGKHYGQLLPTWETDIKAGLAECMRVLKDYGVLIFKWNDKDIKLNQVRPLFPCPPLFGHTTGKHGRTIWVTFIKTPKP